MFSLILSIIHFPLYNSLPANQLLTDLSYYLSQSNQTYKLLYIKYYTTTQSNNCLVNLILLNHALYFAQILLQCQTRQSQLLPNFEYLLFVPFDLFQLFQQVFVVIQYFAKNIAISIFSFQLLILKPTFPLLIHSLLISSRPILFHSYPWKLNMRPSVINSR